MIAYAASKAAQTMLVTSLAPILALNGITINNLAPGVIQTDRNKEALSHVDYAKEVIENIPLGYFGKADDCATVALTILSEAGRYITGTTVCVDGGMSL